MTIILAILLLINAAFNAVVWPPFLRRVKQDERAYDEQGKPTKFLRVHTVLIACAFVIAVASAVAGVAAFIGLTG